MAPRGYLPDLATLNAGSARQRAPPGPTLAPWLYARAACVPRSRERETREPRSRERAREKTPDRGRKVESIPNKRSQFGTRYMVVFDYGKGSILLLTPCGLGREASCSETFFFCR